MDRWRWTIVGGLIVVLLCAGASVALALVTPFDVAQPVTIDSVRGDVSLNVPGQPAKTLDPDQGWFPNLKPDQSLRLGPDSSAAIAIALGGGRALLGGPAELRLTASYRRATALGHALDSNRYDRSYVLTLTQTLGEVRYLFDHAAPPFGDLTITIRLPDRDYVPQTPCWIVVVNADGTSRAEALACPS
jgi:hypothetical protein